MVSKRAQKMDISGIRKAFALAKTLKDPIDLSIGQPDFEIPQNVRDVAISAIQSGKSKYTATQGIDELRNALAKKLKREKYLHHSSEHVVITSAVSGALSVALPAVIDHGDEVLIFDPSFVGYKQLILLYGGKPKLVEKNDDFSVNFERLEQAITKKTKALIFSSPENPTGYVYTKSELEKLTTFAREHNLVIFSDEIYADFTYNGKYTSIGSMYENTVVLGGFSKSHGMMGWRTGYLLAPLAIVEAVQKIQQFTFVCAPTPFQYAALETLQTKTADQVKTYKKRRDMVYKGLKDTYELIKPEGAFYFFIKYPFEGKRFIEECLKHNLIVVSGNSFSAHDTHFRICYATSEEKLQKGIEILVSLATQNSV
jgi:aspartate/methionine/tyrosine aminotransferase